MREILFRGKTVNNKEWVYGYLYITHDKECEIGYYSKETNIERMTHVVMPETVGQYTGLIDKNGTKIFDGDIVSMRWFIPNIPFCKEYKRAKIYYDDYWNRYKMYLLDEEAEIDIVGNCENMLVVGNIYDNPEFLKH